MSAPVVFPLEIRIEPYLRDHRINGRSVLSAVEILQRLATAVRHFRPEVPVHIMRAASFDRFISIDDNTSSIAARHELEVCTGFLRSRLTTAFLTPGKKIRRTRIHATIDFAETDDAPAPISLDIAACLEGNLYEVSADKLYEELVPFGPAYRSLTGSLFLAESGAIGRVQAPDHGKADPLGSPFPFDGAMHAACAWGQRFRHFVAFPVGFEKRRVLCPTRPGRTYVCRVLPRESVAPSGSRGLLFDIVIHTEGGILCEDIRGVVMKDLFAERVRPPEWISTEVDTGLLPRVREGCREFALVELASVADFADQALSSSEHARLEKMGPRRKKAYLAGRLALKRLSRLISGDLLTPASGIETLDPDGILPKCPAPEGTAAFCSLSHDPRFAFAVTAGEPVGADVERISDRILETCRLFMPEEELALADESALGRSRAAVRVWSMKESLSKLTGAPLAATWGSVLVRELGEHHSRMEADGRFYKAWHDEIDDHIFTIVKAG